MSNDPKPPTMTEDTKKMSRRERRAKFGCGEASSREERLVRNLTSKTTKKGLERGINKNHYRGVINNTIDQFVILN